MFDVPNFVNRLADLVSGPVEQVAMQVDSVKEAQIATLEAFQELPSALWDAQTVVMLRTLGLLGVVSMPLSERVHMVAEKPAALAESMDQVSRAVWAGKGPFDQAHAFLAPLTAKVRDNHARLRQKAKSEPNRLV